MILQRHQHPVGIALGAARHIRGYPVVFCQCAGKSRQLFLQIVLHRSDDQLFLCAGQRNIKDAHLFRKHRALQFQPQRLHRHGRILLAGDKIAGAAGKAQLRMQQHITVQVLGIEFLCRIAQKDHRKFQSLGVMDAHDAHRIRAVACRTRAAPVLSALLHPVHKPQKARDTLQSACFVLLRILDEQPQICLADLSVLHRQHHVPQTGAVDQLLNQPVCRRRGGNLPQL